MVLAAIVAVVLGTAIVMVGVVKVARALVDLVKELRGTKRAITVSGRFEVTSEEGGRPSPGAHSEASDLTSSRSSGSVKRSRASRLTTHQPPPYGDSCKSGYQPAGYALTVKSRVVCKSERKLLDASVTLLWQPPSVREA